MGAAVAQRKSLKE